MGSKYEGAMSNISEELEKSLLSLVAAVRGPTLAELAEQVRALQDEVAALRAEQPPRSSILAVGPEVTKLYYQRYAAG